MRHRDNCHGFNKMKRYVIVAFAMAASSTVWAQPPAIPNKVETPTVKVLTGLTVPEFEQEQEEHAAG